MKNNLVSRRLKRGKIAVHKYIKSNCKEEGNKLLFLFTMNRLKSDELVVQGDLSYSKVRWHATSHAATSWSWTAASCHLLDKGEINRSCCLTERQQQLLLPCRHRAGFLWKGWEGYSSSVPTGLWKELGALGSLSSFSVSAWSKGFWLAAEERWLWWHDGSLVPCLLGGWEPSPSLGMRLMFWRSSPVSIHPEWQIH